ncbi:DUF4229 domain-containing protein [Corynebacterium vitaeruminis]|uniref:DUF4229 domain-containing protein n=1 Tax=Corynebacterium vitaeruminis DSM 20294 TaxID=1224164 RepID=W5XYL9_9CORY|nr:DUF4229 domain-containing protein [Corynebacterium vitaeruminis]AHI21784.1 hypothetical protein B843_01960 [Corynebacterium vitaeruminis DSM 20294]
MNENAASTEPVRDPAVRAAARKNVTLYGLARLSLFIVLTAVIHLIAVVINAPVPLLISATLALLVAMPLSMFVFKGLRLRATEAVALWDSQRKAHKEWVKRELASR